jgi:hypothetical protein
MPRFSCRLPAAAFTVWQCSAPSTCGHLAALGAGVIIALVLELHKREGAWDWAWPVVFTAAGWCTPWGMWHVSGSLALP